MSEQVIKTVENVDKLFSQIIVNGETFISDKVVEQPKPVVKPSTKTDTTTTTSTTPKASRTGEDVYAVDLNDVLHNFTDRTTKQNLTEEIRNRTEKDTAMQTELNTVKSSLNTVKASVEDMQALIPNQATKDNQLADKDFVNSSISTNTANFLGTFNTLEEIEALTDVTNNDYAFWKTTDTLGSVVFKRYKYIADEQLWKFEYDLNNSSFTAEQWEAINSGITAELVAKIGDGSAIVPSITEAEYEEIPDKNDGQIREIMDAEGFPVPFAIMNDEMTTSANVLSAQETENRIVAKVTEHPYIMHTVEYGTKWYRLYSDGWCEQGDYGTLNGSESPVQVTFLIPFKTINYSLAIALNENISSSPNWNDFGYDRTENGFKLRTSNKTSWIASGFVDLNNIPEIN